MLQKELKRLREAKGWTQQRLAEKMHISQHALSQYETGKRSITIEMFEDAMRALEVGITFRIEDINMKMKVIASRFFEEWKSIEERFPEWDVFHSGGGIWVLSKNYKTRLGNEIGVWISDTSCIVKKKLVQDENEKYGVKVIDNEYITIEEHKEKENFYWEYEEFSYVSIFEIRDYGWELTSDAHLLFNQEELEEMTYIASLL